MVFFQKVGKIYYLSILLFLVFNTTNSKSNKNNEIVKIISEDLTLIDASRNRKIPITIYKPQTSKLINKKLIIFSHGYFANKEGANKEYTYLTEYLASKGYIVVSIQHELSTDSLIPEKGIPQIVRLPFWERGSENIHYVINEFKIEIFRAGLQAYNLNWTLQWG